MNRIPEVRLGPGWLCLIAGDWRDTETWMQRSWAQGFGELMPKAPISIMEAVSQILRVGYWRGRLKSGIGKCYKYLLRGMQTKGERKALV